MKMIGIEELGGGVQNLKIPHVTTWKKVGKTQELEKFSYPTPNPLHTSILIPSLKTFPTHVIQCLHSRNFQNSIFLLILPQYQSSILSINFLYKWSPLVSLKNLKSKHTKTKYKHIYDPKIKNKQK